MLTLFLAFGAGTISRTILSDDYAFIYSSKEFAELAMKDGRPVSYLLINLTALVPKECVLLILRIVGTSTLIITAVFVSSHVKRTSRVSRFWPFAVMSFCIPAFQIYAQAAYAFPLSIALLLSTIAGLLILRNTKIHRVAGIVLLVAALATYQMSALFLLNLFLVTLIGEDKVSVGIRRFAKNLCLLFCGIVIYFLVVFVLQNVTRLDYKARFSTVTLMDLPEKTLWFITRPLTLSFMPLTLRSPSVLEVILLGGTAFLLVSQFLRNLGEDLVRRDKAFIFVAYFASQIVSLSPLFISRDNQIEPRMLIVNNWMNSFLLLSQSYLWLRRWLFKLNISWLKNGISVNLLITFVIATILIINSNYRFVEYIYKPYNRKVEFLEKAIESCAIREKISIIKRESSWPTRDLLGVWSQKTDLSSDWVPVPAVAIQMSRNSLKGIELQEAYETDDNALSKNCLINLQDYREG